MMLSSNGLNLIKSSEGLSLSAYQDSAGVWTIGFGTTKYPNGAPVKQGQTIPGFKAEELLLHDSNKIACRVSALLSKSAQTLTQHQFDALCSLAYNIGVSAFSGSTVLRRVLTNANDPTIKEAFLMWNKVTVKGKKVVSAGLSKRRNTEAQHYFTPD